MSTREEQPQTARRATPLALEPVRSRRTIDAIVAQIVDHIRSGRLQEGDALPGERAMASQLVVSRPTVRLALSRLTDAGILANGVGRGGTSQVISIWVPDELRMHPETAPQADGVFRLLEARRTLEPRVAQLAAARATDEDFERMEHSIELLAEHGDDRLKAGQAESLFHRLMWRAAGNETLEEMLVGLFRELEVARDTMMRTGSDFAIAITLHQDTLRALKRGDDAEIEVAMDEHLRHVEQLAEEVFGRRYRRELPGFLG